MYRQSWIAVTSAALLVQPASGQAIADLPHPRPQPAVEFVVRAFEHYDVVAISESHWNATEHAFLRSLLTHSEFPQQVRDVVIEFGNSLHQEVLDRYLRGDDVPFSDLSRVWRDTSMSPMQTWDSPVYFEFLKTVREVNLGLPSEERVHVWASERPIDWSKIESAADHRPYLERSRFPADIIHDKVLVNGRKALLVRGGVHLARKRLAGHPRSTVAQHLIEEYGAKLLSIWLWEDRDARMPEVERRLGDWPTPSIALLEGTWFDALPAEPFFHFIRRRPDGTWGPPDFDGQRFGGIYDAVLYIGPSSEMKTAEPDPAIMTPEYQAELARRRRLLGLPEKDDE